jgi:hypothetical protein
VASGEGGCDLDHYKLISAYHLCSLSRGPTADVVKLDHFDRLRRGIHKEGQV